MILVTTLERMTYPIPVGQRISAGHPLEVPALAPFSQPNLLNGAGQFKKIITFLLGTAFITLGACARDAPTWDVPGSIIMGVVTFLLAPWSVDQRVLGAHRGGLQRLRVISGLAGIYVAPSPATW